MQPGLAVVIQLVIASIVQAFNDGDIQLKEFEVIGGDNPTFDGVLQVYLQGSWNTVCYDFFSEAAATAVCRQLGYINYNTYHPSTSYDRSLSVITSIRCPLVKTSTEAEILYILRCDVGDIVPSDHEACDRLAITCDKTKYFYNGQVRIHHYKHYDSSFALLEINLEDAWRPICISTADGMSVSVADSACRQMGYTHANSISPSTKFNKKSWKIDVHSRCMENQSSSPCFTDCINHYTAVDDCKDDDENMYDLPCIFNKDFQVLFSSGTEKLCRYSSESIDVRFYSVTGSLSFVVFVLLIVVIVQFCRHRCRHQPPAAGPAAQPNIVVRWWKDRGGGYGGVHEQRED